MDERIRMADGTELTDTYIVDLGEHITVHCAALRGIREAWAVFGDPEKTERIHSWQFGEEADWTGWTVPVAILTEGGGVAVSLMKEVDE